MIYQTYFLLLQHGKEEKDRAVENYNDLTFRKGTRTITRKSRPTRTLQEQLYQNGAHSTSSAKNNYLSRPTCSPSGGGGGEHPTRQDIKKAAIGVAAQNQFLLRINNIV